MIFLGGPSLLFKHLVSTLLSQLPSLKLFEPFILLFLDKLLTSLLSCLFFEMSIMMLPFVFFHNLVFPLLNLSHLVIEVQLHIIHSHLDNKVGLIYLLNFLLGFVSEYLYFSLSAFLGLLQLIIKCPLPFCQKLLPFLLSYLLTCPYLIIPLLLAIFYLDPDLFCFFLNISNSIRDNI